MQGPDAGGQPADAARHQRCAMAPARVAIEKHLENSCASRCMRGTRLAWFDVARSRPSPCTGMAAVFGGAEKKCVDGLALGIAQADLRERARPSAPRRGSNDASMRHVRDGRAWSCAMSGSHRPAQPRAASAPRVSPSFPPALPPAGRELPVQQRDVVACRRMRSPVEAGVRERPRWLSARRRSFALARKSPHRCGLPGLHGAGGDASVVLVL